MNIYEKLLAITSEIKNVNKNLEVGVGKSSYKAVGEADVLAAVKCLEEKYKVYSYPCNRHIVESDIIETVKTYNGTETKGSQVFMRLETVYRFVNVEKPDEFIDITTYGDGIDTNDKAPGKAMTYADKYALLKAYKIITGDDPDQNHSPDTTQYTNRAKTQPTKATPAKTAKPNTCEECGQIIEGFGKMNPEEMSNYTKQKYGKCLCADCAQKAAQKG